VTAIEDELGAVEQNPLQLLAALEVEGLGEGGGEVDVELLGSFALNQLQLAARIPAPIRSY
jgi:hypothetical protein